jgi:protein-S-isoprenylcysteine O-methyltransferase Ste14
MIEIETLELINKHLIAVVFSVFCLMGLFVAVPLVFSKRKFAGSPTINKVAFFIGKLSLALPALAAVWQASGRNLRQIAVPESAYIISIALLFISTIFIIISFWNLKESTRVGLPREETKLKKQGLYRISRNPMYLGVYLLDLASVLYTMNGLIFIISIIGILIHHQIILGEEEFLRKRFKADYENYCKKVRRYF